MPTFLAQLASAATSPATNVQANSAAAEQVPWPVHLAGDVAWPLAALVIAVILWRPLTDLIKSGRITKLSILNVGIELTPAASATDTPLLNDVRDANAAHVYDSRTTLLQQVQTATPADFAVIDIGQGKEWLTSRLYVAAIMLRRMRGVEVFVFVETAGSTRRRFIAVVPLRQLRWILAREYPWLEAAWLESVRTLFGAEPKPKEFSNKGADLFKSDDGAFEPNQARTITSKFIEQVQTPAPAKKPRNPPKLGADWVKFDDGRAERASWVTRELLTRLLPGGAFHAWAPVMTDAPRARRTRATLRRSGDFIALLDEDRSFLRLINRREVLEELAAAEAEEPDDQ